MNKSKKLLRCESFLSFGHLKLAARLSTCHLPGFELKATHSESKAFAVRARALLPEFGSQTYEH
jgi:hypothetical protein